MKALKLIIISSAILLSTLGMKGQNSVTTFLDLDEHAKMMAFEYLRPYGEMLGSTLNGGWYSSARVHQLGGFSLLVGVNMAMAPTSAKSFDVSPLIGRMGPGWSLGNATNRLAPSIAGEMALAQRPVIRNNGVNVITMPDGTGFDIFPMPIIQASVGLPFNTEISLRFVPELSVGDAGRVNLYGGAIKHSLKDYLPGIKRVPFLQSSVMVGYTHFGSEMSVLANPLFPGGGQKLEINSGALTTRLLFGINIPVLAVYTGIGYSTTNSDFGLKGNFGSLTDPFTLEYQNQGFDFNAGLRLRMGLFTIYGDYTLGDYAMATFGAGLSFR